MARQSYCSKMAGMEEGGVFWIPTWGLFPAFFSGVCVVRDGVCIEWSLVAMMCAVTDTRLAVT